MLLAQEEGLYCANSKDLTGWVLGYLAQEEDLCQACNQHRVLEVASGFFVVLEQQFFVQKAVLEISLHHQKVKRALQMLFFLLVEILEPYLLLNHYLCL